MTAPTVTTVADIQAAQDDLLAGAEGRDLTDQEVEQYEQLERQLTGAQRRDQLHARHAAARAAVTPPVHTGARPPAGDADDTLDRAFAHYLRTGRENADLQQLRAQGESTGSAGGFLVPDTFRARLIERMVKFGGVANHVETITTATGAPMNWPTLDDTSNEGEIVAEGGTFASGADLVFGEANIGAYKYMAGGAGGNAIRVSWELLQDSAFDVEGLLSRKLGERIARIQARHIVRGTGVGEPQGLITDLTGIQTAANNALTYADLLNYVHSVDPAYREGGNCRWAFNDSTLETIRGLLDGNNRPILKGADEGVSGGPGGETLLGYPVTIDQAFSNFTNNSPTVNYGAFGDLQEGFLIRRVREVTVVVDPYTRAANGQTVYNAWARMDAVQQNTNAYIAMTGKT